MVCKIQMKISLEVKHKLDEIKIHHRETYNDIVERLVNEKLNEDCEDGRRGTE